MSRIHIRDIKKQARQRLKEHKPDFRKLAFQSLGITAAYSILVSVINVILSGFVENSQGLSGMGTAALLQTAQMFLVLAGNLLMPFWSLGLLYTSVRVARRQNTEFSMLARGFHRFGPALRYMLLYALIMVVLMFAGFHIVLILAFCIPVPPAIYEAMGTMDTMQMMELMNDPDGMMAFMAQLPQDQLIRYYAIVIALYLLVFGILALFANYRFCLARYLIVDETKIGAFAAMHLSTRMTKGNRWSLVKLDLSFWWYALGMVPIMMISYIPMVLALLNVSLPISDAWAGLIFGGVSVLLELGWMVAAGTYNQVAWACAYDAFLAPPQQPETEEQTE